MGDGENIHIWNDKWIAKSETRRVTTKRLENCQLVKVSELINNGQWNREVLQKWFNNADVQLITSMPISCFKRKDKIYWKHSKSGRYTVKSGYARAKQEEESQQRNKESGAETSWEQNKENVWKRMWSLNIKAKHKHFLWKCLNNILPIKELVQKRIGKCDNICCACGEAEETVEHLLLLCPSAETV